MGLYAYERLSAIDSSFLAFEDPHIHMHIGGTCVLDAGPLATADGGIDVDRVRHCVESRLDVIPRYRQRLAFTPLHRSPVWVDDEHFNLFYHVRHTRIPKPGDERQLKRLTAWILSQQLDRSKPLWELWVVEGLRGARFAVVIKTHHCMIDGIGGVGLLTALMKTEADEKIEKVKPWIPRQAPRAVDLLREELMQQAWAPVEITRRVLGALEAPGRSLEEMEETISALLKTLDPGMRLAPDTPLNQPIGSHRRFDWLTLDLKEVKQVKNRLGGTVNDVVLATVAGAVGRFLTGRGVSLRGLDFRATVPVNARSADDLGTGNQVSAWLTSLPIQERDPRSRLARIQEVTSDLKNAQRLAGTKTLMKLGDWAGPVLVKLGVKLASLLTPYNLIVSNVPGPQVPLYLLGARLVEAYPQVPLLANQGLGIALFSYDGKLYWGFNADWDLFPDLHIFVEAVVASFAELQRAARESRKPKPSRKRGTPAEKRQAG